MNPGAGRWLAIAAFIALAGCTGATAQSGPVQPSMAVTSSMAPSVHPGSTDQPGTLSGQLGYLEVEGGCSYLETAGGTRWEVLYPDGWQISRGAVLRNPQGVVVARAGDTVTVRGTEASDMVSTCQVGPIFLASQVVNPLSPTPTPR